ncbi:eukaryotic translation initiation factor 3 subunit L-like isoform X1 [Apostichopus japonicus]|uniref:eukaryotic translation initiation factor 3 subunit L-like isoform X1 n=1 Tax=Stichopus japonicus TaxID=307972 RepID=UPI003AB1EEBC
MAYSGHGEKEVDPYAYDRFHTGDPKQDFNFEQSYQPGKSYIVPEEIKNFLVFFQRSVNEGNVSDVTTCYEHDFNKLSERFFKNSPWPDAENIIQIVGSDQVFLILYKELFYRHIIARTQSGPSQEQRFESYYNYCNFFNYILSSESPVGLQLPDQWLWDIIDEFIYQFQDFCKYRSKITNKTNEELLFLRQNPKVWNVHSVLNVLHSLVDKSNINAQLEMYGKGDDPDILGGDFGRHPLYKMLGYFSLIGLLRLHSLLGDYFQAIKVLEYIELDKQTSYTQVPTCQVTTYYYVGFAYMMMRRYKDAIRSFTSILLYIQRTNYMVSTSGSYQIDVVKKMNDQIMNLLAICLVLHPMRIDEALQALLMEKYGEKIQRMEKGEPQAFDDAFSYACPRFLSPVPPNYSDPNFDLHKEPFALQVKVFMEEVEQQIMIPTIRSFLKLYTTMPISKLSTFLDMSEDEFKMHLLCFKHKMNSLVWTKGTSGLEGEFQSGSEVDFYIDKEMVHIADTKVARRYGEFFIQQIHKFSELNKALKTKQPLSGEAGGSRF